MVSYYLMTSYTSTIITLGVLSYTWTNVNAPANDPYKLTANVCRPSVLTADVGYALQTNDRWYGNIRLNDYKSSPGSKTIGVTMPTWKNKKRFDYVDGVMVVDEGNSTRVATDDEMEGELGYTRCRSSECSEELDLLHHLLAEADEATQILPQTLVATTTKPDVPAETTVMPPGDALVKTFGSRRTLTADFSQPTAI